MAGMFVCAWSTAHVETQTHWAYKMYSNDIIVNTQDLNIT